MLRRVARQLSPQSYFAGVTGRASWLRRGLAGIVAVSLVGVTGCQSPRPASSSRALSDTSDVSRLAADSLPTSPLPSSPDSTADVVQVANFEQPEAASSSGTLPIGNVVMLGELESMALQQNPSVREARARLAALEGKWLQVGLAPSPYLGYSGQQLFSGGAAEQRGLFVGQKFVRGNKLGLNRDIVAREISLAQQDLAIQEQRVLTDVRLAFNDAQIAQQRIELTRNLAEIARRARETALRLEQAREVSRLDGLRAQTELQTAELSARNALNVQTAAWTRLGAVVGTGPLPVRPVPPIATATDPRLEFDPLRQELLQTSPEVAAAWADVQRARATLQRAIAEPIPDVDVGAIAQHDNATNGANAALEVILPVPVWNRNQGGIQQARAEVVAAQQALQRIEQHLTQRLASVYQQYANAWNQVLDYSRPEGILDNARASLDLVQRGYEAGELDYLDLITAQRTNAQTNLTFLEALAELRAAEIEINGLLLKDSLAGDAPTASWSSPSP